VFATLSSVAIGAQVVILIIVAMTNDPWPGVLALPWLGIAAVVLGLIGRAVAPPHSRVRLLCAIDAVLGVLGLAGMLVVLYIAVRNSTGAIIPMEPTG